MVTSTYNNSKTYSGASISISGDMEQRKITVEVRVHDAVNHTYESIGFNAVDFGKAIDLYNEAVEKFKKQATASQQ